MIKTSKLIIIYVKKSLYFMVLSIIFHIFVKIEFHQPWLKKHYLYDT